MLLSDGAVAAGALCHKILRTTPGVGYALTEDGDVTRVRCTFVPADTIRALAVHFPAPIQIPHFRSSAGIRCRAEVADPARSRS